MIWSAQTWLLLSALAVLALLLGLWLLWTAGRLDRQHLRLEAAQASLDTQLARRAGLASELASCGLVDPATSVLLLEAVGRTRDSAGLERWQAESELTAVLQQGGLWADQPADPLVLDLVDATRRVAMARRIRNDLAVNTRALHDRRRVRWFRLAGRAKRPEPVDFDDRPLP